MGGGGALQLLRGTVTADGLVLCYCSRCAGASKVPNSIFEEHAGSKVRGDQGGQHCRLIRPDRARAQPT
jgi:hypothetical protein